MVNLYVLYCNFMRRLLYNRFVSSYTEKLYHDFLDDCMDNTVILDIGVGNGNALCKSVDIIKKANLQVVGVDICPDSIAECRENISDYGLTNYVKVGLDSETDYINPDVSYYDYVFLSNSYSVIKDIKPIIFNAFSMSKDKQCIITLALFDKHSRIKSFIKRNLKYIVGFDCGRYITHSSLVDELDKMGIIIISKERVCSNKLFGYKLGDMFTLTLGIKPDDVVT